MSYPAGPADAALGTPGTPQTDGPFHGTAAQKVTALSDDEMLSIVQREIDSSLGWTGTRLAEARRQRLQEYFANPRGDEQEGRSKVVTRDTFEQVEWALPMLMEIFTAGVQVASFTAMPKEGEDPEHADEIAEQATAAVNWVFQQNDGFMVLYTMFKDALIQKNGVVKVWWEDDDVGELETYEGKTWLEVAQLQQDPNLHIRELTPWDPETGQVFEGELPDDPQMAMALLYDLKAMRTNETGRIVLENIPPEEFLINRDARGLHHPTCRFAAQRMRTSESQLIAWGYNADIVKNLPGSQSVYSTDQDQIIRSSQDDSYPLTYSYRQDSERTIYVTESYVKVDRDKDGISEWWKVVTGGDYAQVILHTEQVHDHPFVSVTPIPVPHRFYGLALADVVADITSVDTTLWRQLLNSIYLCNDPRNVVLAEMGGGDGESAMPLANINQLLRAVPGGWVEEYQPGAIRPLETRDAAPHILPALELHQKMKERRTGISPDAQGIDPNVMNTRHTYGAMAQQSGLAQRQTLYARIFADTGVKHLFQKIYEWLLRKHTQPLMVQMRGKWVPVNPSDWKYKLRARVSVGLGHGSKMEKAMGFRQIAEIQEKIAGAGLTNIVGMNEIFHAASDAAETWGFKNSEKYFADPEDRPPPQPPPNAAEEALKLEAQNNALRVEMERQKLELERAKVLLETKKVELQHEEAMRKIEVDALKGGVDPVLVGQMPMDAPWGLRPPVPPQGPPVPPPGPPGGPAGMPEAPLPGNGGLA